MTDVDRSAPVRSVASHGAISVDERLTLRSLAVVLGEADAGIALVRRPDESVGVVSERDITRALGLGADPDRVWVADVMSEDLVIAEVDEPIGDVAQRMIEENVRHVVVVDRGSIVGVASMRDVLLAELD